MRVITKQPKLTHESVCHCGFVKIALLGCKVDVHDCEVPKAIFKLNQVKDCYDLGMWIYFYCYPICLAFES